MSEPSIDFQQLREIGDGDPETEERFFRLFLETVDQCLEQLSRCAPSNAKAIWHQLRGAAETVGARAIAHLSEKAEGLFEAQREEQEKIMHAVRAEANAIYAYCAKTYN